MVNFWPDCTWSWSASWRMMYCLAINLRSLLPSATVSGWVLIPSREISVGCTPSHRTAGTARSSAWWLMPWKKEDPVYSHLSHYRHIRSWKCTYVKLYPFQRTSILWLRFFVASSNHDNFPINQRTRCNNFPSLLFDVYARLNMFRASSRRLKTGPTTTNSTATTTLQR